ncbi:MAG: hypothetical protein Kow0096_25730 [Thiohalomonadaceae bacterium]
MPFIQGEFVHDQPPHPAQIGLGDLPPQPLVVKGLDRVPMQTQELRHRLDRHQSYQGLDPVHHGLRQLPAASQPRDVLTHRAIRRAADPPHRHLQPDTVLKQVALTDYLNNASLCHRIDLTVLMWVETRF